MVELFQLHTVVHINIFIMHAFFMWICLEVSFYPVIFPLVISGHQLEKQVKSTQQETKKKNLNMFA